MPAIYAHNVEEDLIEEIIQKKKPRTVVWSAESVYIEW